MRKAVLGLERVRADINTSTLARPLIPHRGVYIFEGDAFGNTAGHLTCDPVPDAWMNIGRCERG